MSTLLNSLGLSIPSLLSASEKQKIEGLKPAQSDDTSSTTSSSSSDSSTSSRHSSSQHTSTHHPTDNSSHTTTSHSHTTKQQPTSHGTHTTCPIDRSARYRAAAEDSPPHSPSSASSHSAHSRSSSADISRTPEKKMKDSESEYPTFDNVLAMSSPSPITAPSPRSKTNGNPLGGGLNPLGGLACPPVSPPDSPTTRQLTSAFSNPFGGIPKPYTTTDDTLKPDDDDAHSEASSSITISTGTTSHCSSTARSKGKHKPEGKNDNDSNAQFTFSSLYDKLIHIDNDDEQPKRGAQTPHSDTTSISHKSSRRSTPTPAAMIATTTTTTTTGVILSKPEQQQPLNIHLFNTANTTAVFATHQKQQKATTSTVAVGGYYVPPQKAMMVTGAPDNSAYSSSNTIQPHHAPQDKENTTQPFCPFDVFSSDRFNVEATPIPQNDGNATLIQDEEHHSPVQLKSIYADQKYIDEADQMDIEEDNECISPLWVQAISHEMKWVNNDREPHSFGTQTHFGTSPVVAAHIPQTTNNQQQQRMHVHDNTNSIQLTFCRNGINANTLRNRNLNSFYAENVNKKPYLPPWKGGGSTEKRGLEISSSAHCRSYTPKMKSTHRKQHQQNKNTPQHQQQQKSQPQHHVNNTFYSNSTTPSSPIGCGTPCTPINMGLNAYTTAPNSPTTTTLLLASPTRSSFGICGNCGTPNLYGPDSPIGSAGAAGGVGPSHTQDYYLSSPVANTTNKFLKPYVAQSRWTPSL